MLYCEFLSGAELPQNDTSYQIYDSIEDLYTYSILSKRECYQLANILYFVGANDMVYSHIMRIIKLIVDAGLFADLNYKTISETSYKEISTTNAIYSNYLQGLILGYNTAK